jgi:hypothetical protein
VALKDANKHEQNIELALVLVAATFTTQVGSKYFFHEEKGIIVFIFLFRAQPFYWHSSNLQSNFPLLLVTNTTYTNP